MNIIIRYTERFRNLFIFLSGPDWILSDLPGTSAAHRSPVVYSGSRFRNRAECLFKLIAERRTPAPARLSQCGKISVTARRNKSSSLSGSTSRCRSRIIRHVARRPWDCGEQITPLFHLHKYRADFRSIQFQARFDIVYFDAFNPEVQPHLWTPEVFSRFAQALKPGGILVTYCVKGIVKQALREVGFTLKRLPGPPGKREMLRATKPDRI